MKKSDNPRQWQGLDGTSAPPLWVWLDPSATEVKTSGFQFPHQLWGGKSSLTLSRHLRKEAISFTHQTRAYHNPQPRFSWAFVPEKLNFACRQNHAHEYSQQPYSSHSRKAETMHGLGRINGRGSCSACVPQKKRELLIHRTRTGAIPSAKGWSG